MGNQQILLIVLGTIIVAIAIVVGITEFRAYHTDAVADQIQEVGLLIAAEAKIFYGKPATLGGGGGSFAGFTVPKDLLQDQSVRWIPFARAKYFGLTAITSDGSLGFMMRPDSGGLVLKWAGTDAFKTRNTDDVRF